ncbi:MAG: hypothetical protein KAR40_05985 [Candidatus Sabulitectum sp.]|nr:hypothetical protein [Candidatus Sabulitectum sp.]
MTFNKQEAADIAHDKCVDFLELNGIRLPEFKEGCKNYGEYHRGLVRYNIARSSVPALNPVRRWSYPGYKADRTIYGIIAHECGHHIWFEKTVFFNRKQWGKWVEITKTTKRISSYEPNYHESFAETSRLFILNPTLLKEAVPGRYDFLTQELELKPSIDRHWTKILKDSPKHLTAAQNWINK